jgi:hypothetical protein
MVNSKIISSLSQIMISVAILGVGIYGSVLWVNWDDINILEKPGNNEENGITYVTMDLPLGTLLYIETITTVVLLVISALGLFAAGNENTRAVLLVFNSLFFSAFAFTFAYRAFTLWGTSEGQCGYIGEGPDYIKSCPVTRHLNSYRPGTEDFWNISHIEPEERNDCIFWFFDSTPPYEMMETYVADLTAVEELKKLMRNTMDWSGRSPYGWYEIDAGCGTTGGAEVTGATDCIQDGRSVFATIQEGNKVQKLTDAITSASPDKMPLVHLLPAAGTGEWQKPDISFCYYWGCDKHCNHERYYINQLLLWISLAMTTITLFTTLLSGSYAAGRWDVIGSAGEAKAPMEDTEKEDTWKNMEIGESSSGILKKRSRQLRF